MSTGRTTRSSWGAVGVDWSAPHGDRPAKVAFGPAALFHDGVHVVLDARIDNEAELRRTLGVDRGPMGELLARAYRAWGDQFANHLSGDFAIALWDERGERFLAVRDHLGVRPLFYRAKGISVQAAPTVAALLTDASDRRAFDERRIAEYLLGTYASRDATFFRAIKELPGGNVLVADRSGARVLQYWRPQSDRSQVPSGEREAHEEYRRLFVEAVRERLASSSPVILHVSGGVDSSSVAVAADLVGRMGQLPTPAVRGVASVHPGLACDEGFFIDAVARRVRFPIDRWDGTVSAAIDQDLSQPAISRPGIRALYRSGTTGDIESARAHGASVILSGTGGDEMGTVVGLVRDLLAERQWSAALSALFVYPGADRRSRGRRLKQLIRQSLPPGLVAWNQRRHRAALPTWLSSELRPVAEELLRAPMAPSPFRSHLAANVWSRLTSARFAGALTQLQEHGQQYGIEYRFPFLDLELVSYVLALPHDYWPRPRAYARLHRTVLSSLLPPEVAGRFGKAEFTPALLARTRRAATQIDAVLAQGPWLSEPYVDRVEARRFCRGVLARGEAASSADLLSVWTVTTLEAWLRKVFEYDTRALEDQ